ncbi:MAG TPA: Crp/Fnr family transcriptional regulator [Methylomirabilota bacterium]|nr:Crp/Fnr family transcriptional regulator [Methylomirabilota bacterium]
MAMRTRYGLQAVENCLTRPLLQDRVFSNLSRRAVEDLQEISSSATYEKGSVLFTEGEESRGVFVLGNSRVKLSASSPSGKSLILRISEPGEVVGLPSAISGKPYAATAEVLESTQASFIPREAFLEFLRMHGEAALKVAEILSDIYHATYQEVRYLGLTSSAAEKLARFILDLEEAQDRAVGRGHGSRRTTLTLTHEEIAERIGASRETVTRVLASFRRKRLVETHGSSLSVTNRAGLEKIAHA